MTEYILATIVIPFMVGFIVSLVVGGISTYFIFRRRR